MEWTADVCYVLFQLSFVTCGLVCWLLVSPFQCAFSAQLILCDISHVTFTSDISFCVSFILLAPQDKDAYGDYFILFLLTKLDFKLLRKGNINS